MRSWPKTLRFLLVAGGAIAFASNDGVAQTPDDQAALCAAAGGRPALCAAASVAARSLFGHVGLLGGLGSEVSGTASNLGRRIGGGPRLSFSVRFAAVDMGLPDPSDITGLGETNFVAAAVQTGVAVGLFDGLRLAPTVGGFLSLDVFGQTSLLFLPKSEGFGGSVRSYTLGARVGVLREGFTVPGVSISVARRYVGEFDFGGRAIELTLDPAVTSVRAAISKDFFAVELMAGLGWDDYTGDATLRTSDLTGFGGFSTSAGKLSESRFLYFGSAAMTFGLILSVSVEGGWAKGFDPVSGYAGEHDPTKGTAFGSFSFRLTI